MSAPSFMPRVRPTRGRVLAARMLAGAADLIQIGAFPIFFQGAASPINDVLDVLMAVAMTALLGWHWSFLPTFVAEMFPVLDLFPSWTAAVFFVTRGAAVPAPEAEWKVPGARH